MNTYNFSNNKNQEKLPTTKQPLPFATFKSGLWSAAIWENTKETEEKSFTYKRVSLQNSTVNKQGEWQHEDVHFYPTDIPRIEFLLSKIKEVLYSEERT